MLSLLCFIHFHFFVVDKEKELEYYFRYFTYGEMRSSKHCEVRTLIIFLARIMRLKYISPGIKSSHVRFSCVLVGGVKSTNFFIPNPLISIVEFKRDPSFPPSPSSYYTYCFSLSLPRNQLELQTLYYYWHYTIRVY